MQQIQINETLTVGAAPEVVIATMTGAVREDGSTVPFEVFLLLEQGEAIRFANAILHAAANLPEEDFSDVPAEYL